MEKSVTAISNSALINFWICFVSAFSTLVSINICKPPLPEASDKSIGARIYCFCQQSVSIDAATLFWSVKKFINSSILLLPSPTIWLSWTLTTFWISPLEWQQCMHQAHDLGHFKMWVIILVVWQLLNIASQTSHKFLTTFIITFFYHIVVQNTK